MLDIIQYILYGDVCSNNAYVSNDDMGSSVFPLRSFTNVYCAEQIKIISVNGEEGRQHLFSPMYFYMYP